MNYRNRVLLITAIIMAAFFTAWTVRERGILIEERTRTATEELSQQVLRFHVLADSDSAEDQEVKMKVKEAVVEYLQDSMPEDKSLQGTRQFVKKHLEDIETVAAQTVLEAGSNDPVTAKLETDSFPEKTYGDVTFPEGEYEALRILIGSGKGHNWWCCLYPNLCFTDAVHAKVVPEDKRKLEEILDEDTYDMITCTSDFRIKWFFLEDR